jgi:nitrate reductase gamma subunit
MLAFLFGAFLVSVYRIARRTMRPLMRLISTPDDYFSLIMLTVWFGLGVCTQAYLMGVMGMTSETLLVAYLYLTSFFLLYVPFSKISHYLYYPFTRTYIGRALGHRGSYPVVRS